MKEQGYGIPTPGAATASGNIVHYPVTGGSIQFNKSTGTVMGCEWAVTAVNIPATIEGCDVTAIGFSAFKNCGSRLTRVTIPEGVAYICNRTFCGCSGLTSINIPNSVTLIGDFAFQGCEGLTSITIPDRVTCIGDFAFQNCKGLTSVTISNSVTFIGRCIPWLQRLDRCVL